MRTIGSAIRFILRVAILWLVDWASLLGAAWLFGGIVIEDVGAVSYLVVAAAAAAAPWSGELPAAPNPASVIPVRLASWACSSPV